MLLTIERSGKMFDDDLIEVNLNEIEIRFNHPQHYKTCCVIMSRTDNVVPTSLTRLTQPSTRTQKPRIFNSSTRAKVECDWVRSDFSTTN